MEMRRMKCKRLVQRDNFLDNCKDNKDSTSTTAIAFLGIVAANMR